jgi:hypothetical protein
VYRFKGIMPDQVDENLQAELDELARQEADATARAEQERFQREAEEAERQREIELAKEQLKATFNSTPDHPKPAPPPSAPKRPEPLFVKPVSAAESLASVSSSVEAIPSWETATAQEVKNTYRPKLVDPKKIAEREQEVEEYVSKTIEDEKPSGPAPVLEQGSAPKTGWNPTGTLYEEIGTNREGRPLVRNEANQIFILEEL